MLIDEKINRIKDVLYSVPMNKVTLLTGDNGSGKSLIRKQMFIRVQECFPKEVTKARLPHVVKSVSMQLRTESRAEFGALSDIAHDCAWNPTSIETYHLIKRLFNTAEQEDKKCYLIIDEPEIGMSLDSQYSISKYIRKRYEELEDKLYGLMIITHSEMLVREFSDIAEFKNLDGYDTIEAWMNRQLKLIDFEALADESHELFSALQGGKYKSESTDKRENS